MNGHTPSVFIPYRAVRATALDIGTALWRQFLQNIGVKLHRRQAVDDRRREVIAIATGIELERHAALRTLVQEHALGTALRHGPHNACTVTIGVNPEAARAIGLLLDRNATAIVVSHLIVLAIDNRRLVVGRGHTATIVVAVEALPANWNALATEFFLALLTTRLWRRHARPIIVSDQAFAADRNALVPISLTALRASRMRGNTAAIRIACCAFRAWQRLTLPPQV